LSWRERRWKPFLEKKRSFLKFGILEFEIWEFRARREKMREREFELCVQQEGEMQPINSKQKESQPRTSWDLGKRRISQQLN